MSAHDAVREQLAALCHAQWSGWMRYLVQFVVVDDEGRWILDSDKGARWQRQMSTPYDALSELEKESDRAEADRVLSLLEGVSDQMADTAIRNVALYSQNGQLLAENKRLRARIAELEQGDERQHPQTHR